MRPTIHPDFPEQVDKHCRKQGYSKQYREFWQANMHCQVCLDADVLLAAAAPHHIRSRGAGGDDSAENLLPLCTSHHTEIHQIGTDTFAERHPCVATQIRKGRERKKWIGE